MNAEKSICQSRGFLPHFIPEGLWLYFNPGSSGVFEIFWYSAENFKEIIKPVDYLESFCPDNPTCLYYERTLVNMKIIPEDTNHPWMDVINEKFNLDLYNKRDIEIPESEWDNFPSCPVWVYSNPKENAACMKHFKSNPENPILWQGSK